jgi:hypothetical protein
MNVRSKKFPKERCSYPAKRGEFCSRHFKNPVVYEISMPTRSITASAKKIQKFWRTKYARILAKERGPAFFIRTLCHNDTELASFEPLDKIPNAYFFVIKEVKRLWGFDIRTLVIQYEEEGKLENPYTKELCPVKVIEDFKRRVDKLKRCKMPLHYEADSGLTPKQSWNLRVLDICLRLDVLGYRIATHWFTDLNQVDIFLPQTIIRTKEIKKENYNYSELVPKEILIKYKDRVLEETLLIRIGNF